MTNMFRVKGNEENYRELSVLGFVFNNSAKTIAEANTFMCGFASKSCIALSLPEHTKSPRHQPMIDIKHVASLVLLPDFDSRILLMESITKRKLRFTNPK